MGTEVKSEVTSYEDRPDGSPQKWMKACLQ